MAESRRQRLINNLETKLGTFITEYEEHINKNKNNSGISRAFFDVVHYAYTGHSEKGYLQRVELIKAVKKSKDENELLGTIKSFYNDWNTESNIQTAVRDVYFMEFGITHKMIDELAKEMPAEPFIPDGVGIGQVVPQNYKSCELQTNAKNVIMQWIMNNNFGMIETLRLQSLRSNNELKPLKS